MVIKATGNNQSRTVHRVFQRSNSSSSTLFLAAHLHENTNHESPCYSNLEVLLEIGICSDWSGISYACPCGSPSCRTLTLLISNPSPPSSCIIKDFVETTIKKVIRSPLNQYSFRWLATKDLNHFGIDFGSAHASIGRIGACISEGTWSVCRWQGYAVGYITIYDESTLPQTLMDRGFKLTHIDTHRW